MAFIRKKGRKGYEKFYVVENRRVDGKVKQTILACLGRYTSVPVAIGKYKEEMAEDIQLANKTDFGLPARGRIKGKINSDPHLNSYFTGGYGNACGSQPGGCWLW